MNQVHVRAFEALPGVWRSQLPKASEIAFLREVHGLQAVLDLTRRPRPTVERACHRLGVRYEKFPMEYDGHALPAARFASSLPRPLLIHCFHGRDRTGRVMRALAAMEHGSVHLYRVGRNLNRAIRTMEAFGMRRLHLVECDESFIKGNLFGATGRVEAVRDTELPSGDDALVLETGDYPPLSTVDLGRYRKIIIGGETSGTPPLKHLAHATIPMAGKVSGLTVEAALAIALYEWTR